VEVTLEQGRLSTVILRRIRRLRHVARMEEMRTANKMSVGKPDGIYHIELGIDGRIILKWS